MSVPPSFKAVGRWGHLGGITERGMGCLGRGTNLHTHIHTCTPVHTQACIHAHASLPGLLPACGALTTKENHSCPPSFPLSPGSFLLSAFY